MNKYFGGFRLITELCYSGLIWYPCAAVNILKGDAVIDNGAGFATSTGITAFVATFIGVALADCSNSGGAAGDLSVPVIVPIQTAQFWVPNEVATVAAATDVGEKIDLNSEDGVSVADTTLGAGWGFWVDAIDISTAAVAVMAGGFVKGRFLPDNA